MLNKRIISLILIFSFVFSASFPVNAEEVKNKVTILSFDDGTIYAHESPKQYTAVSFTDGFDDVEINFSDDAESNIVYKFHVEGINQVALNDANSETWNYIMTLCATKRNEAEKIEIISEDVTYETPIDITKMRGSIGAQLMEDLKALHGDEYDNVKYTTTYKNQKIRVRERLDYRITENGYKNWSTTDKALTIGTFIVEILKKTKTGKLVKALSYIFGVANSVNAIIASSGKITYYNCKACFCRYTTVNGSEYAYTTTDKIVTYEGYNTNTDSKRAAVDEGSGKTTYTDSKSYYNDYPAQRNDAYSVFKKIGQKD